MSNKIEIIKKDDERYPKNLLSLGDRAPEELYYMGNADLLDAKLDAVIGVNPLETAPILFKQTDNSRNLILSSLAPDELKGITFRLHDVNFDKSIVRFVGIMNSGFDDMETKYGKMASFYEQCVDSSRIYENEDWRALLISPYPIGANPADYPFTATEVYVALCDRIYVDFAEKENVLTIKELVNTADSLGKEIFINRWAYARLLNTK